LARKLLIALWRLMREGIVPDGVVLRPAAATFTKRSSIASKNMSANIHHVNTLESHWSLFQRAVKGTHVHISAKHAWKYVSEFSYRRNMRHSHWSMFNLLVHAFALPRVVEN
jgi:hypothetical protein